MAFIFSISSSAPAVGDLQTSATPNTEQDDMYTKFSVLGAGFPARLQACYVGGKSAGLTVISGIAYRLKQMTTGGSSSGTSVGSVGFMYRDVGGSNPYPGGTLVANISTGLAITPGTGAQFVGGFTSGATGPGGWIGPNANSYVRVENSTSRSIDLFSASATPSLKYEAIMEIAF